MILPKLKFLIFTIVGFCFIFFLSNRVFACGPFFPRYIYTPGDIERETSPFLFIDVDSFLNSNYEIVSSGWCSQSLYPVYRDLINNSLTQQEKERLSRYYKREFEEVYQQLDNAIVSWKEARKLVTEEDVVIEAHKCENYSCYINCLPDAFLTAANTLRERSKIYNSEELKIWLDGQDKVFSNCGERIEGIGIAPSVLAASANESINSSKDQGLLHKIKEFFSSIFTKIVQWFQGLFTKKPIIPPVVPEEKISVSELLKYDQEYQQAATYFYQENFDDAEKRFQEIANNLKHPWRAYAALALGRTYIRKGQFEYEKAWWEDSDTEEALQIRNEQLGRAKTQFEDILKTESLSSIHNAVKSLLNYVNFRLDPERRFKETEEVLLTSNDPEEIVNNLEDFSLLFPPGYYPSSLENGDDLSQWIYIWKNLDENNLEFALQKYQQTKSLPWLLVSLKLMTPNHPLRDQIINDSLKIPKDSPAYLTTNYYRLKLLIKTGGNTEEIKRNIDSILETIPKKSSIAKNYFNDLGMITAKDLKESLSYSLRKIVAVEYGITPEESEEVYLIDGKIKQLFNEVLPLKKWVEIALTNDIFSPEIIKQIRLITFVRSVLLDDFETAEKIANLLASTDSTLKEDLSGFLQAKNYDEKKFTSALFILRYPRLNYVLDSRFDEILVDNLSVKERDEYRRNWWCSYPLEYGYKSYDLNDLKKFVSSNEIQEAKLENEKIYRITAPNYLSESVINYALKNPADSRVPEALHLTVRSTRSAECKDEKTSEFSQRAFQILHNNYPNNYWTNQTPYWY